MQDQIFEAIELWGMNNTQQKVMELHRIVETHEANPEET